MCVCVCVCVCARAHACVHILYIYIHSTHYILCRYASKHIRTPCTYVYIHRQTCDINSCIHTYMCVCTYIRTYTYVHTYIDMQARVYTDCTYVCTLCMQAQTGGYSPSVLQTRQQISMETTQIPNLTKYIHTYVRTHIRTV